MHCARNKDGAPTYYNFLWMGGLMIEWVEAWMAEWEEVDGMSHAKKYDDLYATISCIIFRKV